MTVILVICVIIATCSLALAALALAGICLNLGDINDKIRQPLGPHG